MHLHSETFIDISLKKKLYKENFTDKKGNLLLSYRKCILFLLTAS